MQSKVGQIREAWMRGDRIAALRVAAKFHDRSAETVAFKRGFDAMNHAAFYRQLGRDPDALVAEALNLLAAKFRLRA